jgi:hypothetical protein
MAEINIYYQRQTNSWWADKEIDGFSFNNYIKKYPIGLGTLELDTNDKKQIDDLYEIHLAFIPDYIKKLNNITEEIQDNGFDNALKVTKQELDKLLK